MEQKRDKVIGMALVMILGASCLYMLSGEKDTQEASARILVDWMWNDYNLAISRAQSENKCILIDFWAVWCKECKEMDKKAFQNPEVVQLLKDFVLLKVDVDDVPELKAKFAVGGMPTIIIVTPEGEEVARIVGYQNAEQLKTFLEGVLQE